MQYVHHIPCKQKIFEPHSMLQTTRNKLMNQTNLCSFREHCLRKQTFSTRVFTLTQSIKDNTKLPKTISYLRVEVGRVGVWLATRDPNIHFDRLLSSNSSSLVCGQPTTVFCSVVFSRCWCEIWKPECSRWILLLNHGALCWRWPCWSGLRSRRLVYSPRGRISGKVHAWGSDDLCAGGERGGCSKGMWLQSFFFFFFLFFWEEGNTNLRTCECKANRKGRWKTRYLVCVCVVAFHEGMGKKYIYIDL